MHISVISGQLLMVWLKDQELGRDGIRKLVIRSLGRSWEWGARAVVSKNNMASHPSLPVSPTEPKL